MGRPVTEIVTRVERGVYTRTKNGKAEFGSRCDDLKGATVWKWGFARLTQARHDYQERRSKVRVSRQSAGEVRQTHATVAELRDLYLPTIEGKHTTYDDIKRHLDWWAGYFKQQPILTVTSVDIEKGMAALVRAGVSGVTANRYASSLRRLGNKLVRPGSWSLDVWKQVEFYPERKDPLPPLKGTEEDRLLAALGYPDVLYVRLAVIIGIRRTEFFRLRWEYVWWEHRILKIPAFKRHPAIDMPVPEEGIEILTLLWEEQGRPTSGWMFPVRQQTYVGIPGRRAFRIGPVAVRPEKHVNANNWYRNHYKPAVVKAGLGTWVTFHTLRRTWASRTGASTPARILQLLGRWKNMKTAERYCQPFMDVMRDAMERGAGRVESVEKVSFQVPAKLTKISEVLRKQRQTLA